MASITPVDGMHNIYFVFKNNSAKANQPLMQVTSIDFKNTASMSLSKK